MNTCKLTLRDVAIKQNQDKTIHKSTKSTERTLLIIGSKCVGKTNIVSQLIEKERGPINPPSTYLLEYRYGRQSGKSLAKDVCHIWELGSGTTFAALLSVAAKVKFGVSLALILVLDLTFPETIVSTAETLLDTTKASILKSREFAENGVKYSSPDVEEEDRPYLHSFPVPLVIIGGKYDIFQNLEPSKKRITCQYLRCLAHIHQADLLFYSNSDTSLIKKVHDFLLPYAFGIPINKNTIITDYNKPLRIPAGCDSFRSIQGSPEATVNFSIDKYKNNLIAHFNQEPSKHEKLPADPATDPNFMEKTVDNLCAQKSQELNCIQADRKKKMLAIQSMKRSTVT